MQKFNVNGQSIPKIEWKQTDGRTEAIALPLRLEGFEPLTASPPACAQAESAKVNDVAVDKDKDTTDTFETADGSTPSNFVVPVVKTDFGTKKHKKTCFCLNKNMKIRRIKTLDVLSRAICKFETVRNVSGCRPSHVTMRYDDNERRMSCLLYTSDAADE